jgi:peroxiredoxin
MKKVAIAALVVVCLGLAIAAFAAYRIDDSVADTLKQRPAGSIAPSFTLTDTNGKQHKLADYKGRHVVLEWVNLGCPYVKKQYDSGNMQATQKKAVDKGVIWLSVCSSGKWKQGHLSAAGWNEAIAERKIASTAVLIDEGGEAGKAYGAKTTPHMYIINPDGFIIYQGAIDDTPTARKQSLQSARNHVLAALDEALNGKPVTIAATQPYGCSVKYQ